MSTVSIFESFFLLSLSIAFIRLHKTSKIQYVLTYLNIYVKNIRCVVPLSGLASY